ncbi:MAG: hypothetical protein ACYTXA_26540 [Nostoc sp.]
MLKILYFLRRSPRQFGHSREGINPFTEMPSALLDEIVNVVFLAPQ